MNRIIGIVKECKQLDEISRLTIDVNGLLIKAILLDKKCVGDKVELAFKENNVLIAKDIKCATNVFSAKIINITKDSLFADLLLESNNFTINAIIDINLADSFEVGNNVVWNILESEIMIMESK